MYMYVAGETCRLAHADSIARVPACISYMTASSQWSEKRKMLWTTYVESLCVPLKFNCLEMHDCV